MAPDTRWTRRASFRWRWLRSRDLFLSAALAATAWTATLSQPSAQSAPRFGIVGGLNLATFAGRDFPKASHRTGFAAGLIAVLPVASRVALQPELMFTAKGAHSDSGGISATANVYYVELPLLARFEIPAAGRAKLFVYGGPGYSYNTSCTLEGRYARGAVVGFEGTIRADCYEQTAQARSAVPGATVSRTDVDGIIGGGLAFDVGGRTTTLSVRYDVGFVKLISYTDYKNRVLSFLGTVEWPCCK